MTAQITDLLDRTTDSTTGRPVISSIASGGKAIGATSLNITDATNWTTTSAIHFSIYKVTAQNYKDPSTQTDWKGVLSGTTITNLTLTGGTDQAYVAGDKVELTPTARYPKDLYDWGITHANPDGTLKTTAVQNALNISTTSTDWTPLANVPTLSASNGQREHQLTWTGVDYTGKLQAGTKLQIPRTSTAPTQSGQFVAASSQYASKASPAGVSFTTVFTAEAWINIPSYTAGNEIILSRADATNEWTLGLLATGQLRLTYGTSPNYTEFRTYQSIPLNKWTHVAFVVTDVVAHFATPYIDGVAVPVFSQVAAANAVPQSGNLQIGAQNGGSFFNGTIAQARLWSTARTAQNIRDNANKTLLGTETGLVGSWTLNGVWTDQTSNANTLTPTGAINNYADNPWKATEYAIVTGISFTGGNTVATVFTGSNTLPNETLGSTSYSSARAPYGFPTDKTRWRVSYISKIALSQSNPVQNTWYNPSLQLSIPTGSWMLVGKYPVEVNFGSAVYTTAYSAVSSSATAPSSDELTTFSYSTSSGTAQANSYYMSGAISLASQALYYGLLKTDQTSGTLIRFTGNSAAVVINAECAFL